MSRAQEIIHICEVGIGTVAGVVRGGVTAARFKQKWDDKVRQAGMGDKLDKAKVEKRKALKKRLINPLSKTRKQAHIRAADKVADVKDAGQEKFKKMFHSASGAARGEVT
jgi:hypothetical protein